MLTAAQYPHLTFDADGTARIGETRYKVLHLAGEHYYDGLSAEEILKQHPDLRPQEVYAALTYFYDRYEDLVQRLKASAAAAEAGRPPQAVSRLELLRRKARQN
jgi:uncharacterized protein (DUF433 family)